MLPMLLSRTLLVQLSAALRLFFRSLLFWFNLLELNRGISCSLLKIRVGVMVWDRDPLVVFHFLVLNLLRILLWESDQRTTVQLFFWLNNRGFH